MVSPLTIPAFAFIFLLLELAVASIQSSDSCTRNSVVHEKSRATMRVPHVASEAVWLFWLSSGPVTFRPDLAVGLAVFPRYSPVKCLSIKNETVGFVFEQPKYVNFAG
jgi:hypothetical protein